MANKRYYSKTKLAVPQLLLKCLRHRYIALKYFLAPTFNTCPEVFWKQWTNLLS